MVTWLLHSFSLPRCVLYDLTNNRGVSAAQVISPTFFWWVVHAPHTITAPRCAHRNPLRTLLKCSLRVVSAAELGPYSTRSMPSKLGGSRRRMGTTRTPFLQACMPCSLSWLNLANFTPAGKHIYDARRRENGHAVCC